MPVIIQVMSARSPCPAPKLCILSNGDILKLSVAAIAIERVAPRMPLICLLPGSTLSRNEMPALNHPLACIRPHIGDIQISLAVAVVIEPAGAHAGTYIFHSCFLRKIAEPALFVHIKVLSPKIVGDVQ